MFFRKRKKILQRVMCHDQFIAAYSKDPFFEEKEKMSFPDYVFYECGGLHWCVRVGEIEIPWGFGNAQLGFGANGSLIVKRRNVAADSLDMKGIAPVQIGSISYIFVNRVTSSGREGFARYLEPRLTPYILDIAEKYGAEGFRSAFGSELLNNEMLKNLFDDHEMVIVSASVNSVKVYEKKDD